jgi:hypothetical protein
MSRDDSVNKMVTYVSEDRGLIPRRGRDSSLCHRNKAGLLAQETSYTVSTA